MADRASEHRLWCSLDWALSNMEHRAENACGVFCKFCRGGVKPEDYKGFVTDKITHKKGCQWVIAMGVMRGHLPEGVAIPERT